MTADKSLDRLKTYRSKTFKKNLDAIKHGGQGGLVMSKISISILYGILTLLLVLVFLSSLGCGYAQSARTHCTLGTQICDNLFGQNVFAQDERIGTNETAIRAVEAEILTLRSMVQLLISGADDKSSEIYQLNTLLTAIQMSVTNNEEFVNTVTADLQSQINDLQADLAYEQDRISDMIGDIAELQLQDSVTEYVYPCTKRPNSFDEVFLKMKSGKLVAYFEGRGNERFLTVLSPGNYESTDAKPACKFTVTANSQIINARR